MYQKNYAPNIQNNLLEIANPAFWQVFDQNAEKYGQTTAFQRIANRNNHAVKLNSAGGTTKLQRHLKECTTLTQFQGEPIPKNMPKDATIIVLNWSEAFSIHYLL